jgi:hypothetical protein
MVEKQGHAAGRNWQAELPKEEGREARSERRAHYEQEFISSERQFRMMEISTGGIGSYRRVPQLRVRKEEGRVPHTKNMGCGLRFTII